MQISVSESFRAYDLMATEARPASSSATVSSTFLAAAPVMVEISEGVRPTACSAKIMRFLPLGMSFGVWNER